MAEEEKYKTHKEKQSEIETLFMKESMLTEMKKKLEHQIDNKSPDLLNALKKMIADEGHHE